MDDATLERVAMLMARKTPEEWEALSLTLKIDWRRLASEAVTPVEELGLVVSEPGSYQQGLDGVADRRAAFLRLVGRYLRKQEGWWDAAEWDDIWGDVASDLEKGVIFARLRKLDRIEAKVPELIAWAESYRMNHVAFALRDLVAEPSEVVDGSSE